MDCKGATKMVSRDHRNILPHEPESKLLHGGYTGSYISITIGLIKGDTRSLDYSSHGA